METIGRPACTETAFVVSMTLPPPRATRPSASLASSTASRTPVISACGRAPWKRCATGSSVSCQSSSVMSSGALTESSASTSSRDSRPQRTIMPGTIPHLRFPCTGSYIVAGMAENGRILTTHVGSLPRPQDVVDVVFAQDKGEEVDPQEYDRVIGAAVKDRVQHQVDAGVDLVSDGEMSKIGYATFIRHRLSGFEVGDVPRATPADLDAYPSFRDRLAAAGDTAKYLRPICRGPIAYENRAPLE